MLSSKVFIVEVAVRGLVVKCSRESWRHMESRDREREENMEGYIRDLWDISFSPGPSLERCR